MVETLWFLGHKMSKNKGMIKRRVQTLMVLDKDTKIIGVKHFMVLKGRVESGAKTFMVLRGGGEILYSLITKGLKVKEG